MEYSAFEAMSVSSLTHITGLHNKTSPEYRKMNMLCPIWISSLLKCTFPTDQGSTRISWSTKARSFYYDTFLSQAQGCSILKNNHVVLPPAAPMNRVLQNLPTLIVRHLLHSSLNLLVPTFYSFDVFYHRALAQLWAPIFLASVGACLSSPASTLALPGTDIQWSKPMGKATRVVLGSCKYWM